MGLLLNGSEKKLFDQCSYEVLRLAGADDPILWRFFEHAPGVTDIDCIYKEPAPNSKHYKPFKVMCHFEEPDTVTQVGDDGKERRVEGRIWFVRLDLENAKVPIDSVGDYVNAGDIVQLFSKSKKTWYFELINATRTLFEHNSDVWTHYVCDVVRNDSFIPEKKVVV